MKKEDMDDSFLQETDQMNISSSDEETPKKMIVSRIFNHFSNFKDDSVTQSNKKEINKRKELITNPKEENELKEKKKEKIERLKRLKNNRINPKKKKKEVVTTFVKNELIRYLSIEYKKKYEDLFHESTCIKRIGKGAFGSVIEFENSDLIEFNGLHNSVFKRVKILDSFEYLKRILSELKVNIFINKEYNDLKFANLEDILDCGGELESFNCIYYRFRKMKMTLSQVISMKRKKREPFTNQEIHQIMYELTKQMAILESLGIIHCDLKPSNILINPNDYSDLLVIDFSLVSSTIDPIDAFKVSVVSIWYRSIELFDDSLRERQSRFLVSTKIDCWSLGCIFIQLFMLRPLFPGRTKEKMNYLFNKYFNSNKLMVLANKYNISDSAINLMKKLLDRDHNNRISLLDAYSDDYFRTDRAKDSDFDISRFEKGLKFELHYKHFQSKEEIKAEILKLIKEFKT